MCIYNVFCKIKAYVFIFNNYDFTVWISLFKCKVLRSHSCLQNSYETKEQILEMATFVCSPCGSKQKLPILQFALYTLQNFEPKRQSKETATMLEKPCKRCLASNLTKQTDGHEYWNLLFQLCIYFNLFHKFKVFHLQ